MPLQHSKWHAASQDQRLARAGKGPTPTDLVASKCRPSHMRLDSYARLFLCQKKLENMLDPVVLPRTEKVFFKKNKTRPNQFESDEETDLLKMAHKQERCSSGCWWFLGVLDSWRNAMDCTCIHLALWKALVFPMGFWPFGMHKSLWLWHTSKTFFFFLTFKWFGLQMELSPIHWCHWPEWKPRSGILDNQTYKFWICIFQLYMPWINSTNNKQFWQNSKECFSLQD